MKKRGCLRDNLEPIGKAVRFRAVPDDVLSLFAEVTMASAVTHKQSRTALGSLTFALVLLGLPALSAAQTFDAADTTESARGIAMGTGVRSSAAGTSALAYNPANLSLAHIYHVESGVAYDPGAGRFGLIASIVDSTTDSIAAGLSFRTLVGGGDGAYGGYDGRVSLGMALGEAMSIGLSGRYLDFTRSGQLPSGVRSDRVARGFTLDASLRVSPAPGFHLSALGLNLIDLESGVAPVQTGGSASYTAGGVFTLGGDVLVNLSRGIDGAPLLVGGGLEWLTGGRVPLRAGYVYDELRATHVFTAGLGYVDQSVGVDLALRQDVAGQNHTLMMASFRYFVR